MPTPINSDWDGIPHTYSSAVPVSSRHAVDVLAIRVTQAHLRGSFFDGVCELADVPQPFDLHAGKLRVQVKVAWFGVKPPTCWANITLGTHWELIRNYSGTVIHNLGER